MVHEKSDLYPAYNSNINFHFRPDGAFVGEVNSVTSANQAFPTMFLVQDGTVTKSEFINTYASKIAYHMQGQNSLREIINLISKEISEFTKDDAKKIEAFVEAEIEKGRAKYYKSPQKPKCKITGSQEFFHPTQIAIELTYECNCKCLHCYAEAGDSKHTQKGILATSDIIHLVDLFIKKGVRTIELTGGETMMHPGFWEILDYACSRVPIVGILSNGYFIDEKATEKFSQFKNIGIGISLDGPNAEVHDYFRQCPGSFKNATKAIKLLSDAGVIVRASMDIWSGNYHLIDETIDFAMKLGAVVFAASPVQNCGRASDKDEIALRPIEHKAMWTVLEKNVEKHGIYFMNVQKRASFATYLKDYFRSCGAGSKDVAISPEGDVRPCVMTPCEYSFGNILKEDYDEIFRRSVGFASLHNTGGEECQGCQAYYSCKPCLLKGLRAHSRFRSKGFESCNWGRIHKLSKIFSDLGWDFNDFLTGDISTHSGCKFELSLK